MTMEKMKMHTPDLTDANIQRIRELFPSCITETKDAKGNVKLAVDFDQLRQELSDSIVEGPQERYHLNWPGKREALLTANAPISKTLRPCWDEKESVGFEATKNLFIEGDNLEALKLLQEAYLGLVKVIYIDPPYNTGNDFLYDDNYVENTEDYLQKSNQKDALGNRLIINTEANGRFHSDWLSTMYPRLKLARNLLREDGVLFISIDDWEVGNLRRICDEIYGQENFIGLFCRKTKSGGGSASGTCAVEHDYVLAFAKNNGSAHALICEFDEEYLRRYKDTDEDGPYFWDTMERSSTKTKPYKITAPDGSILTGKWFRSEDTFKKDLEKGEVRFLKKEDGWSVQFKQRLSDGKKLRTILEENDLTDKKYRSLNQELEDIIGCNLGHPPKPVELLTTLTYSVTPKPTSEDIILDFFAGSGTTAHAVMALNAQDGGNRKFILVQLPEPTYELKDSKKVGKAAAARAFELGFETVADLCKERLRKAGKEFLKGQNHESWNKDIGFRVLKIDTSNMAEVYYTPDGVKQDDLLAAVDNIKPDRKPEDLLFQVLLDWGVDLSLPITKRIIQGKTVFFVDGNALVACFDNGITEELVKELAGGNPLRVVFRDNGFVSDSVKINAEQIFKQMSPGTDVKSI